MRLLNHFTDSENQKGTKSCISLWKSMSIIKLNEEAGYQIVHRPQYPLGRQKKQSIFIRKTYPRTTTKIFLRIVFGNCIFFCLFDLFFPPTIFNFLHWTCIPFRVKTNRLSFLLSWFPLLYLPSYYHLGVWNGHHSCCSPHPPTLWRKDQLPKSSSNPKTPLRTCISIRSLIPFGSFRVYLSSIHWDISKPHTNSNLQKLKRPTVFSHEKKKAWTYLLG